MSRNNKPDNSWLRTNKRYSRNRHIFIISAHTATLTLKTEFLFFAWHSGLWWCTTIPSLLIKGCIQTLSRGCPSLISRTVSVDVKHHVYLLTYSAAWEQIFVTSVASLTRDETRLLSILWWNNTPHTAQKEVKHCCRKSADVDSYVRVGRKSPVLAEIVCLCART